MVFGMPGWENSQTLRLDYLNTGEVHFTSSMLNATDTIRTFITRYKDKYENEPNHAVYTGYEIGSIFIKQLDQFGVNYFDNLINQEVSPLKRKYHFIEVLDENGEIDRIENTALIVYKIHEFEQVRLR